MSTDKKYISSPEWMELTGRVTPSTAYSNDDKKGQYVNQMLEGETKASPSAIVALELLKELCTIPPQNISPTTALKHPYSTMAKILFRSPFMDEQGIQGKRFLRGNAEIITSVLGLGLLNWIYKATTIALEILCKRIGYTLINPYRKTKNLLGNKENNIFIRFGYLVGFCLSLVPWAIGQTFSYMGNAIRYSRNVVDSFTNLCTRFVAWCIRDKTRYDSTPYKSVKTLAANLFLLIPAAAIAVLSFVPGLQFLPAAAQSIAPLTLPIKAAIVTAVTAAAGTVAQLYSAASWFVINNADKFTHWIKKSLKIKDAPSLHHSSDEERLLNRNHGRRSPTPPPSPSSTHSTPGVMRYLKGSAEKRQEEKNRLSSSAPSAISIFNRDKDPLTTVDNNLLTVPGENHSPESPATDRRKSSAEGDIIIHLPPSTVGSSDSDKDNKLSPSSSPKNSS